MMIVTMTNAAEWAGTELGTGSQASELDSLEVLRAELDAIDSAVVGLIVRRCALAQVAGGASSRAGLTPGDLAREAAVVREAAAAARTAQIDEETVRQIFWRLVDLGRRAEQVS